MIGAIILIALGIAPASLQSAKQRIRIKVERSTGSHNKAPIFLECRGDSAVSMDRRYAFAREPEENVIGEAEWSGTPFTDFLNSLATDSEYVLFIVRPEGLTTFWRLRAIVVKRDEAKCTRTVVVQETLANRTWEALPRSLRARLGFGEHQMQFVGAMSSQDRDALRQAFATPEAQAAVDRLYEKSDSVKAQWVDYGSELIPSDWQLAEDER